MTTIDVIVRRTDLDSQAWFVNYAPLRTDIHVSHLESPDYMSLRVCETIAKSLKDQYGLEIGSGYVSKTLCSQVIRESGQFDLAGKESRCIKVELPEWLFRQRG